VTKAATKYLRSPKLSDADIVRGKTTLKAEILYAADNDAMHLENMGQQAIIKGCVYKPFDLVAKVDKITASEVKSVCRFHFSSNIVHFTFQFTLSTL